MTTMNSGIDYDATAETKKVIESLGKARMAVYEQQFKDNFNDALSEAKATLLESMYRYLVVSFPIKADSHIPPLVMRQLNKREAPACFTGDFVCISSEQLAKMSLWGLIYSHLLHFHGTPSEGWPEFLDQRTCNKSTIASIITAILAHEYTHALCGHAEHVKAHMRKFKDQWTFTAACEIQANRGVLVQSNDMVYDLGITDDVFPEAKNCYSLEAIYTALRDKHGDKIDQSSGNDETEQKPNGTNKSANNNGDSSNDEQKSQNQNANKSANNSDASSSADNDANKNSNSGNASNNDSDSDDNNNAPDVESCARQQQAIERMKKQNTLGDTVTENSEALTRKASPQASQEQNGDDETGAPNVESCAETTHKLYDYDPNTGMNVPRPDTAVNPRVLLEQYNDEYKKRQIRKSLRNLRSVIKGDMSKTKTKTYSRPPRRCQDPGNPLLRKGTKRDTRSVPKVLVALDQSGSMSDVKVTQVAEAISAIVDEIGRTTKGSYICRHDYYCHDAKPLKDWRDEVQRYDADGCNDFSAVYELAQKLDVDVVLNVGDGGDTVYKASKLPEQYARNGKTLIWYDLLVDENLVNRSEAWYWREVAYDVRRSQGQFIRKPIALVGALASKNWNEAEALYGDNI